METFHTIFERDLTDSDQKKNIPFPVDVPSGTTELHIRLRYSPHVVDNFYNMLTLTVFDPSGWRGAGHRHGDAHQVTIAEDRATPGYLPGPVPTGTWTVFVDTHMVMPGPKCHMWLEVTGKNFQTRKPAPSFLPGHTASRGPGWYRGDLHAHTAHSDAKWNVAGLVAFARRKKLDFATLSDHNTIAGLAEMRALASDDLLTMGGMELTTYWGHALVLGIHDWVDWRTEPGGRTMEQIQQEVAAQGATFIIAHPGSVGDPYCTGCQWVYPALMPGNARVVEVWNGEWVSDANNEIGLKMAYEWLNQGYRLALTAGTDNHGDHAGVRPYPFSVVYAQDLSEAEILRAVRAGRLFITRGPHLLFNAAFGDQRAMMGDVLDARQGSTLQVSASWEDCPPGTAGELIVDGQSWQRFQPKASGSLNWDLPGGEIHWALVTFRDAEGDMLALTNPIFFDGRS